ncbi:MAG: hypothetical protein AAFV78_11420, partial [Bacteroidota bacterium]
FPESVGLGNAEKYIYRIKELDIDGKQDYSPKIEVNIPRDLSYITVGPNPFENLLQIQGNAEKYIYRINVQLFDAIDIFFGISLNL